nr:hypothetical protein [Tanacetum cinerariifolium]
MNQNLYNSNSSGFDQTQPPQFLIIHLPPQETSIEILHDQENKLEEDLVTYFQDFQNTSESSDDSTNVVNAPREPFVVKQDHGVNSSQNPPHIDECCYECGDALDGIFCQQCTHFGNKQYKPEDIQELFRKLFNDVQNIHEELAEYINTPSWNRPAFYNNGEDDDEDYAIAITPDFLTMDSLIMGDEHLDTIPEKESDEFIKSSIENLVPNPSEFEDECECDVPDCDDS